MASDRQESALSEVIGFILILGVIAAAASLYLVYVVPAQGREAEIGHMEYIRNQFADYKISIDSLWINNREDVTLSRTITLGTLGGKTQGSFLNIPLFQPYGSSGTMVVNGREDTVAYSIDAITEGFPGNYTPNFSSLNGEPRHLYIEFRTENATKGGGVLLKPSNGNWSIWLNSTLFMSPSSSTGTIGTLPTLPPPPGNPSTGDIRDWINNYLVPWTGAVNSTVNTENDLTISVVKNGNLTLSNWIIKRNIQNNVYYTVDLIDEAYGLSSQDLGYPFSILRNNQPLSGEVIDSTYPWLRTNYPLSYGFNAQNVVIPPHRMGALEYLSNNYYWIQQNYYYQDGAVFLEQPDDGSVVKVTPSITLNRDSSGRMIVQITDIEINSLTQSIGGTGSVEVTSFILSVNEGRTDGIQLARGIPNARTITILIRADDEASALAWDGAFRQVRNIGRQNGVPESWSSIDPHISGSINSTFRITGDPATSSDYDLILDYSRVNMSASLQSVAI